MSFVEKTRPRHLIRRCPIGEYGSLLALPALKPCVLSRKKMSDLFLDDFSQLFWQLTTLMYHQTLVKKYTEYAREVQFLVLLAHGVGRKTIQKFYPSSTLSVMALRAPIDLNCQTRFTCDISLGACLSLDLGCYYLLEGCCWSMGLQLNYSCASVYTCWSKLKPTGWFPSCPPGQS